MLNYLLSPEFQIVTDSGRPDVGGWLEVYIHGTRTKYYCASDFNGTLHPFKIPLDSLGSNIVLAEDDKAYDVYAYNRFGSLLMSRYNVTPGKGGGSGGIVSELQHWLGMYGPTYTPFPGDDAGHTLGISKWEREYVGDFIDRIETCPYPDGTTPEGYIYLKPGLYFVSCIIRYQQADDSLSNTLDEILIYTGAGNANESLAYQMDSSGPEATGNRHNVRVQFIRKVPDNVSSSILYFAPGTPVDWKEAYIQRLEIVKLDGIKGEKGEQGPVGATGPQGPQGEVPFTVPFVAGEGVTMELDSDGEQLQVVISAEGRKYQAGSGIEIDSDGVISVDSDSLPTGPQGPEGPQGPQGVTGPQGPEGPQGSTGPQGEQGIQGIQGIQGPQGPTGSTGPQGAQGIQGQQGQTGADGKSAYEIWLDEGHTGSEQDFLNSLVGQTGATGPEGPQGQQGIQGIQGVTGPQGPQGATGPAGSDGTNGADGKSAYEIWLENGHSGSEEDFLASLVGQTGATGPEGPKGPTGATGEQGIQGIQGIQGATGADGKSAYEIWLGEGNTGSEQDFLNSLVGQQGATGPEGPAGSTGPQGEQGIQGIQGVTGPQGPQGATGPEGPQGPQGATGPTGTWGGTVDQTYDATSSNPQSGTAVAEAVATKEDEFDAGDGLEFTTDSDGNRVLQVEGPVDVVAGPGIVIDNPDGNTLRISQQYPTDETVLFNDSNGQSTGTFSETISNFERIKVLYVWNGSTDNKAKYVELQAIAQVFSYLDNGKAGTTYNWFGWGSWEITTTGFSLLNGYQSIGALSSTTPVSAGPKIYKVIGVHRIANN